MNSSGGSGGGIMRRDDDHSIFMNENVGAQGTHYKEPVGLKDLPVTIVYQKTTSTFPGTNKAKIEEGLKNHIYLGYIPKWKYFKIDKIVVTSSAIETSLNPKKWVDAIYTWVEVEPAPQGKWRVKAGQSVTSNKESVTI